MFVLNKTSHDVVLKKGHVTEDIAVGALIVPIAYRLAGEELEPLEAPPDPVETDPPDTSLYVLWEGISITAAGRAHGPPKPPYVQPVSFRIGTLTRRLIVFGDRIWDRSFGGGLVPSTPKPFDAIPLGFDRAFGGGWDLPPGIFQGTDLPHPGGRVSHELNPLGKGYYPDEARAAGNPLPNVERPEQLLKRWDDSPEPAGFTPCRELIPLRMREHVAKQFREHLAGGEPTRHMPAQPPPLRLLHHAPPDLIHDGVDPGTPIELTGLGAQRVRFDVPRCPATVVVRGTKSDTPIEPRLRVLHVDADRGVVHAVFDHTFRYNPRRAPRRVRVMKAEANV